MLASAPIVECMLKPKSAFESMHRSQIANENATTDIVERGFAPSILRSFTRSLGIGGYAACRSATTRYRRGLRSPR